MKAFIFDFGNVIINIDVNLTYINFGKLIFKSPEFVKKAFDEQEIFKKFELGMFSEDEFREVVRQTLYYPLNDHEIDDAWNSLLLDVPKHRLDYLINLSERYPIYLLSNTNSIHIKKCKDYFLKTYGIKNFLTIFNQSFLSYEMGLYKPDYKIYDEVIKQINLTPEEVVFFDDNEQNIISALDLGIKAIKIDPPKCFTTILDSILND